MPLPPGPGSRPPWALVRAAARAPYTCEEDKERCRCGARYGQVYAQHAAAQQASSSGDAFDLRAYTCLEVKSSVPHCGAWAMLRMLCVITCSCPFRSSAYPLLLVDGLPQWWAGSGQRSICSSYTQSIRGSICNKKPPVQSRLLKHCLPYQQQQHHGVRVGRRMEWCGVLLFRDLIPL